jgi:hypothetical protein
VGYSQVGGIIIDSNEINLMRNKTPVFMYDMSGKPLPLSGHLSGQPLFIYFDNFKFYPSTNNLEISGATCVYLGPFDTVRSSNLKIVIAEFANDTMNNLIFEGKTGFDYIEKRELEKGKFRLVCKISSGSSLLFYGMPFLPVRYSLARLFNVQKKE